MLAARILIVSLIVARAGLVYAQPAPPERAAPDLVAGQATDVSTEPLPEASEPSPEQLQAARAMFQRGVQFAQKREFAAAANRFREALAIHYAPAVEYNLASALFETGQYPEAYNRTQAVLLNEETNESLRPLAERLERTLRPYVARLTLVTSGEAAQIAVHLDGEPVPEKLLGVPQAVTPGKHQIVATRGETTISEREVTIPVRTAAIIDVSVFVTAQQAAVADQEPDAHASPLAFAPVQAGGPSDRSWKQDWRVWTGVAAGVLAVGVGVTLALTLGSDETSSSGSPVQGDSEPGVLTW